jgi:hypothetical protein
LVLVCGGFPRVCSPGANSGWRTNWGLRAITRAMKMDRKFDNFILVRGI